MVISQPEKNRPMEQNLHPSLVLNRTVAALDPRTSVSLDNFFKNSISYKLSSTPLRSSVLSSDAEISLPPN